MSKPDDMSRNVGADRCHRVGGDSIAFFQKVAQDPTDRDVVGVDHTVGKQMVVLKVLPQKSPEEIDALVERERQLAINLIGRSLAEELRMCQLAHRIDLIIPIPAEPVRIASRRYNQSGAVAKAISAFSRIPLYTTILRKIRATRSLKELSSAAKRAAELAGSMEVAKDKISLVRGNAILLVDDVVTHGTHFKAAKEVLTEAGQQISMPALWPPDGIIWCSYKVVDLAHDRLPGVVRLRGNLVKDVSLHWITPLAITRAVGTAGWLNPCSVLSDAWLVHPLVWGQYLQP